MGWGGVVEVEGRLVEVLTLWNGMGFAESVEEGRGSERWRRELDSRWYLCKTTWAGRRGLHRYEL